MAKINSESVAAINDAFGRSISLMDLISLLNRFLTKQSTNPLSDSELVQVIQMGSYFARNKASLPLASANLDHWLNAGSLADPAQVMKHDLFMNLDHVVGTLCGKHYDAIVAGINSRLSAPAGTKFPASAATFTGPLGKPIVVNPAESPLRAGGKETIYMESSTLTDDRSLSDLYNAVGAVFLVSQVNVESEVLDTGGWRVTIIDWQAWFWDSYDWNLSGQSVVIPLDLFHRLPAIAPYQSTIEAMLKAGGIPPSVLQELKVEDAQMRQIEGKKIAMPDGSTMQPKAYPIYSDGSWHFDATSSECGKPTVLTIAPP
jgi:hypothetical protein